MNVWNDTPLRYASSGRGYTRDDTGSYACEQHMDAPSLKYPGISEVFKLAMPQAHRVTTLFQYASMTASLLGRVAVKS